MLLVHQSYALRVDSVKHARACAVFKVMALRDTWDGELRFSLIL
jgi:hypothetical protein